MIKAGSPVDIFRSRSLLRLVLLAFGVTMLPIIVLIYQAGQALSELSELADSSARQAVEDTRRAQTMMTYATEIERSARQYAVLEDANILSSYRDRLMRFDKLLDQQAERLGSLEVITVLRNQLEGLRYFPDGISVGDNATAANTTDPSSDGESIAARSLNLHNTPSYRQRVRAQLAQFAPFSDNVESQMLVTRDRVDTRIEHIRERARVIYAELMLRLTLFISLSLAAIVFFSWKITHPIRQLEQRILSLGSGKRAEQPPIKGPAELVRLGERLDWLSERLDDLEAQKQRFLRHMSHELKTPLAAIREGTGLLADGMAGALSKRQREIILLIDDSSAELQMLIEQLLDYNVLQHNRDVTFSRFDVVTLIHEILNKHRLAFESKGLHIEVPRQPVYWEADRVRTGRIIDNLVSNTIAYGEDNGSLWLRAWCTDDHLIVEVANSGERISAQDQAHLFEPFYQGQSRRSGPLKGSGIGLSVAAESAHLQNGRLELVEDAEEDVCFRLTLPRPQGGVAGV